THLSRVALFRLMSKTQWPAVATRFLYRPCRAVPVHQCGLPSAPMKKTLPTVRGRLTFFAVAVDFLSPLEPTRPGLVVAAPDGTVDLCFVGFRMVSTPYGVAFSRFAAFSASQKAATCWAAKLVCARVFGAGADLAVAAGAATAA